MSSKNLIICFLFGIVIFNFIGFLKRRSSHQKSSTLDNYNLINSIVSDTQTTKNMTIVPYETPQRISSYPLTFDSRHLFSELLQTFITTRYPNYVTGYSKEQLTFTSWKGSSINRTHRLFIFSAWLDQRGFDKIDAVRIIAIASVVENLQEFLRCVYFFEDGSNTTVEVMSSVATGSHLNFKDKPMQGYIVTCPASPKSTRVQLYFREQDNSINIDKSVEIRGQYDSGKNRHELSACVFANLISDKITTAIDSMDNYRVLEWIVTQKMLGVQHMTVYINQINPRHARILPTLFAYNQANRGFLQIRSYSYIFKFSGKNIHDLHSSSVASDCFYGYMRTSKRVMLIGFEEYLIPKKKLRLLSLIKNLEKLSKIHTKHVSNEVPNLVFNKEYFFANFLPRFDITPYSIILRYVLKSDSINLDPSRNNLKMRSVVSTSACAITEFNRCKILGMNSSESSNYFVPESLASFHNYESCDEEMFDCQSALASFVIDKSILNFEKVLIERLRSNVIYFFKHNL